MATFTVQDGYAKRAEIKLKEGPFVFGRDSDCDFIIETGDVSRKHARAVMKKDGKVIIEDLNSSNGTFLNSNPIKEPTELKHMDVVQLGRNMLLFNDENQSNDEKKIKAMRDGMKTQECYTFAFAYESIRKLEENIAIVFKGKPEVIKNLIICLLADGHLLIEDVPGVGKSMIAQALAKSIQGTYKRIQFTPDMLPTDITGMSIYDESSKEFSFVPGPIFGNIILADEINRTTPRTQSSLLECMSESIITIDGKSHVMPKPFYVIATQNPADYHGTYPLPEPQLDRFMMHTSIGYPDMEAEKEILSSQIIKHPLSEITHVVTAMDMVQCQALVRQVHIADAVKDYIVKIADATRRHPALSSACSPRASLALMRVSQSLAIYNKREYVIPKDIREVLIPVLGHRMTLKMRARGEWQNVTDVLNEIIEKIPIDNEEKGL